jgi:hypothetical protein
MLVPIMVPQNPNTSTGLVSFFWDTSDVELIWWFLKLKSGYDGHFSLANVQRMATTRTFVVKNNGAICVDKGVHLATA